MPSTHQVASRLGAFQSWANTVDRAARTAPARRAGPGSIDYWLGRLDPERFAHATEQQRLDAAEAARKAYFARLALKSAASRKKGGDDAAA